MSEGALAMKPEDDKSEDEPGTYIAFDPKGLERRELIHHPTDFTIGITLPEVSKEVSGSVDVRQVAADIFRVTAESVEQRDALMMNVRDRKFPVHHVYHFEDTKEELVIADRIYLTLDDDQPEKLKAILDRFPELDDVKKQIGRTHVLQVSDRTKQNPLKIANQIAQLDGVEQCSPKILPPVRRNSAHLAPPVDLAALTTSRPLLERQWHLIPSDAGNGASINVQQAWGLLKEKALGDGTGFGDPNIVIAVIDDGFDVGRTGPPTHICHPVFFGKEINPAARNLGSGEPGVFCRDQDFHGTAVASIATGTPVASIVNGILSSPGNGMLPVAPSCGFLPVRIEMSSNIDLEMVLEALQIASESADVVNCSFGLAPSTFDIVGKNCWFVESIREMVRTGGRRHKGLVIVFGAGNDDAPTFLPAKANKQGIRFPIESGGGALTLGEIKSNFDIHSGFPEIPGVVVVAAMSSSRRKAGYSNWGCHVTVAAPSDNGHDMTRLVDPDPDFNAANGYPGLGLVAAVNQPSHGQTGGAFFQPLTGSIPGIAPLFYTDGFGRTSGAAPIVTGVVALILSANDQLTAAEVITILKDNTDTDLDFHLDLENDPNLRGISGEFVDKHSLFFGAGKVNAGKAVRAAFDQKQAPETLAGSST
jgi:subtilisin family serine protease